MSPDEPNVMSPGGLISSYPLRVGTGWGAGSWPFVARHRELAVLGEVSRGAVLIGEAGIGKSRLLAEAVDRIAPSAGRVVRVAATESLAAVPFGAFAGALALESEPRQSVEALSRFVHALAGDGPLDDVVVAVDDAHLLDEASAGLLFVAARSGARVLATVRTHEPCPDAVVRLWKDELAPRLDVQPLDEQAVGELLHAALGAPVDERSRVRLFDITRGNLMFLRELVRHAQETDALTLRSGVWRWVEPATVAPGVLDLVEARLRTVSGGERDVVELLAVGEPLGRTIVDAVCGRDACAAAEQSGIVVGVASGGRDELRLVHPLYAQVVLAGLAASRRKALAGRIAEGLAAGGRRRRDDRLRIALMSLEAGTRGDPRELDAAVRDARSRGDIVLAERFARAAVAAGGALASEMLLGDVLFWANRFREVTEILAPEPAPDAPPALVTGRALVMSSAHFWGLGDFDSANDLLEDTIGRVGPAYAVELLAKRSEMLMFAGRPRDSIAVGLAVLADPRASADARLRAYSGAMVSQANCGKFAAVEAQLPTAMSLVAEAGPDVASYTTGGVMVATFVVEWFSGRLHKTDERIGAMYARSLQRPADPYLGFWSFMLGRSALAQGRLTEATVRLRDAAALLRERDPGEVLPWALGALAQALGAADDGVRAKEAIDEMLTVRNPSMHHIDIDLDLGRAWAASAQGERTRARDIAIELGRSLLADGRAALAGLALHDALRLGAAPSDVVDDLERVAEECDAGVFDVLVQHARARHDDDIDGMLAAADGFEQMGWLLAAAECAAGASAMAAAEGLRVRQREAALRAAALASVCGPALTPMLETVTAKRSLGLLTRREQEIALLAVRGLSKREIADTLSLSARTVGNHINHVYGKLGISSRAELAIALSAEGVDATPSI